MTRQERELRKRIYMSGVKPYGYVVHTDRIGGISSALCVRDFQVARDLVRVFRYWRRVQWSKPPMVYIDTSDSISAKEMAVFVKELTEVQRG